MSGGPSTSPKSLDRLHVFRALAEHVEHQFGIGLVLVPRGAPPHALPYANEALTPLLTRLSADDPTFRESLETALVDMLAVRDGRPVAHPLGFQIVGVPCPINGRSGRLVAFPFLPVAEAEASRARIFAALLDAGASKRAARTAADKLPALDRSQRGHLLALMRVMAQEASRFEQACELAHQRLDGRHAQSDSRYPTLIGRSDPMRRLFALLSRLSNSEATVYIHGANGTGKELVAQEIHRHSRRSDRPFIVQNCAALNDNLLTSELFGHRRGAFTGAFEHKPGLFELAHTGTFFLDEVGDMSPNLQMKLLRVLQEGTFTPVGGVDVRKVDVRVICATNRDLAQRVKDGHFREDLYYRINVIGITVPPLSARKGDIPLLVEHFLDRAALRDGNPGGRKRLSDEALHHLVDYDWPGNVRELENEIERLLVLTGPLISTVGLQHISPHIRTHLLRKPAPLPDERASLPETLERIERTMIHEQLRASGWNKTRAAEALGISRRNLIRKVQQYGFEEP